MCLNGIGLNVVVGSSEMGKSMLLDALHAVRKIQLQGAADYGVTK